MCIFSFYFFLLSLSLSHHLIRTEMCLLNSKFLSTSNQYIYIIYISLSISHAVLGKCISAAQSALGYQVEPLIFWLNITTIKDQLHGARGYWAHWNTEGNNFKPVVSILLGYLRFAQRHVWITIKVWLYRIFQTFSTEFFNFYRKKSG